MCTGVSLLSQSLILADEEWIFHNTSNVTFLSIVFLFVEIIVINLEPYKPYCIKALIGISYITVI